jgi:hypothetical protein
MDFGQRESVPMAEETAFHLLQRRRRELAAQVSALKGQLTPKEAELAQIDHALTVIKPPPASVVENFPWTNSNAVITDYAAAFRPFLELDDTLSSFAKQVKTANAMSPELIAHVKATTSISPEVVEAVKAVRKALDGFSSQLPDQKYQRMTHKELVVQALVDHFPDGGTMMQIRDFIRLGYGRTIEPSSMRPQMHRLKADGILGQDPSTDTWNFQDGKRRLYAMYDHPTSRAAMTELQDEPVVLDADGRQLQPDDPEYLTRLAESLAWKDEDEPIKPPEPEQKENPEPPPVRRHGLIIKKRKIP